jgi:hypothetical protein
MVAAKFAVRAGNDSPLAVAGEDDRVTAAHIVLTPESGSYIPIDG